MTSGTETRWDVFIAYASSDRDRARGLYAALKTCGLTVCYDEEVLRPGEDWHQLLPELLTQSSVAVYLVGSRPASSGYYQRSELIRSIDRVRQGNMRLIPVLLDADAQLPYGTEQLQAISMFTDESIHHAAHQIVATIRDREPQGPLTRLRICSDRIPTVPVHFTGRSRSLAVLAERARPNDDTLVTQVLTGMGGIGKTLLAAALADQLRDAVDIVWWTRADKATSLAADIADLGAALGLDPIGLRETDTERDSGEFESGAVGVDLSRWVHITRRWLESTTYTWLLVYDDAQGLEAIGSLLPNRGRGSIVITTRNQDLGRLGETVQVETLTTEVAEAFLRDRTRAANPSAASAEDVNDVVQRLDGLPLALEQAASWVARIPNRTFGQYAELLDGVAGDAFPDVTKPPTYGLTASTAWSISIAAAAAEAELARRLLEVLAFLSPEDIPCQWLREGEDWTEADTSAALDALHVYSLARISASDTVSVHSVIQTVTRRSASPSAPGSAVRVLKARLPIDPTDEVDWHRFAALAPHAIALGGHVLVIGKTFAEAGPLTTILCSTSAYGDASGSAHLAKEAADLASAVASKFLHEDDPVRLRAEAVALSKRPDFPRDNLSVRAQHESILERRRRILGAEHVDTLDSETLLALQILNYSTDEGAELLKHVKETTERQLGTLHRRTILAKFNYAGALESLQRPDDAIALLEEAVRDSTQLLGPNHKDTVDNIVAMGMIFIDMGEIGKGMAALRQGIEALSAEYGGTHTRTHSARLSFAHILRELGHLDGAISILEELYAEHVERGDSWLRIGVANDLGVFYREAARFKEAIDASADAVRLTRALPGVDDESRSLCDRNHRQALIWLPRPGTLTGHRGTVTGIAIVSDETAATCSEDGTVRLWERAVGTSITISVQHGVAAQTIASCPQNRDLAVAWANGLVSLTAAAGAAVTPLESPTFSDDDRRWAALCLAFSPKYLAAGGLLDYIQGTIHFWDRESGRLVYVKSVDEPVTGLAFHPRRGLLVSSGSSGVALWDYAVYDLGGDPMAVRPANYLNGIALHPHGDLLAIAESDRIIVARTSSLVDEYAIIDVPGEVPTCVSFTHDGLCVVAGFGDGSLRMWAYGEEGLPSRVLAGHRADITAMRCSPSQPWVASASDDWTVRFQDLEPMDWSRRQ